MPTRNGSQSSGNSLRSEGLTGSPETKKAIGLIHSNVIRMAELVKTIEQLPAGNFSHENAKAEYKKLRAEAEKARNGMTDKEWRKEANFYLRTVEKPVDRTGARINLD